MKFNLIAAALFFATGSFAFAQSTTTTHKEKSVMTDTAAGMPSTTTTQTEVTDKTALVEPQQKPAKEKVVVVTKHAPGSNRRVVKTKRTVKHQTNGY
jgi:hypothetical protein